MLPKTEQNAHLNSDYIKAFKQHPVRYTKERIIIIIILITPLMLCPKRVNSLVTSTNLNFYVQLFTSKMTVIGRHRIDLIRIPFSL